MSFLYITLSNTSLKMTEKGRNLLEIYHMFIYYCIYL